MLSTNSWLFLQAYASSYHFLGNIKTNNLTSTTRNPYVLFFPFQKFLSRGIAQQLEKNCGRNIKCLHTQSQAVISAGDADIQVNIQLKTEWVRLLPNRAICQSKCFIPDLGTTSVLLKIRFSLFPDFCLNKPFLVTSQCIYYIYLL